MIVSLIDSANATVDIATPSFASWSGCTPFANSPNCTPGCSAVDQRDESFPVFPALLNAMRQRGVKVRIVTNDFGTPDCAGTLTPLSYLALNGATVRWYNQTTFMHAKYVSIDGKRMSVSSINFSKTSFTRNREAGAVLEGPGTAKAQAAAAAGFERDFDHGSALTPLKYNASDMAIIVAPDEVLNVTVPPAPANDTKYFVTPAPKPVTTSAESLSLYMSPDYAYETLVAELAAAHSTFDLMIYQVTGDDLCNQLLSMAKNASSGGRGVTTRVFVSSRIYGDTDCQAAKQCYARLIAAGVGVRMTSLHFTFSHQKFWIRDRKVVTWSTGNWSPSDYPKGKGTLELPAYGNAGWRSVNRDYTVSVQDAGVVAQFQQVMDQDWHTGNNLYNVSSSFTVECGFNTDALLF